MTRFNTEVKRVGTLPIVAVRLWLRGGARFETLPGQALVTGRLLAEGSRHRDWRKIAEDAENRGMILQTFGTYETLGVSIDAMADDWRDALAWMAELVLESTFPADRCDWLCRQARGELESLLDQPEVKTGRAFLEQLYDPHPYSRALLGNAESLAQIEAGHCADLHRQALEWGVLAVVTGQIDEDAVQRHLNELFQDPRGATVALPTLAPPKGLGERHREIIAGEADQVHIYAGHLTVPRRHPDTIALSLLGVVLGASAGMSGRLPERIREREGLAYHVDIATYSGAGLDPGRLVAYVATSPKTAAAAEQALREELERVVGDGITEEEMEEARSYLIGSDPFRRETARQWADLIAEARFYDLKTDQADWIVERLQEIRRQDVEEAARRWIRPEELRVTVGKPKP